MHRRPVYIYLFNVPSFSSRHFNKIKQTSRLGRLLALLLEILTVFSLDPGYRMMINFYFSKKICVKFAIVDEFDQILPLGAICFTAYIGFLSETTRHRALILCE